LYVNGNGTRPDLKPNYTFNFVKQNQNLRGLRNPKNGSSDNWTREGFHPKFKRVLRTAKVPLKIKVLWMKYWYKLTPTTKLLNILRSTYFCCFLVDFCQICGRWEAGVSRELPAFLFKFKLHGSSGLTQSN
jgi:hypothetical protein